MLPPGPRLPSALQAATFIRRPIEFLERCHARYGDCFRARFPGVGEVVYVADPAEVKRIYTGSPQLFHAGEANARMFEPVVGRYSLLTLDEGEHLAQRRLLLPPFQGEAMRRFEGVFADAVEREVESWPVGRPFELLPAMRRVTMEVILRAVLGVRERARLAELSAAILRLDRVAGWVLSIAALQRDLGPLSPAARFRSALADMDRLLYREIGERREAAPGAEQDVLSLLLAARHEDGSPMSDRELRDEVATLVAAGYETTSTSLSWLFERVLRTPRALERLRDHPDDDEYLDAVVTETLRVRSAVTDTTRILTGETELAGWSLPPGTQVVVPLPLLHLRPQTYADPHAFRPERWLDGGSQPYTFIPFGGGVRRCIGASFAQAEMKVVLRTVLERARLRAASEKPEAQRLHHVVLVPSRGARVVRDGPPARLSAR